MWGEGVVRRWVVVGEAKAWEVWRGSRQAPPWMKLGGELELESQCEIWELLGEMEERWEWWWEGRMYITQRVFSGSLSSRGRGSHMSTVWRRVGGSL